MSGKGTAQKNKGSIPLFWQLMAMIMLVWVLLLGITLVLTMHYSLVTFQGKIDGILESTVKTLAQSSTVRDALRAGRVDEDLGRYLDTVVENTEDLDYITIADAESVRLYHIDRSYVGLPFEGGDEDRALAGESYLSEAGGSFGDQRRAFFPVLDDDGRTMGFVMASTTHTRLEALRDDIYQSYFHLMLILAVCTLVFCSVLAVFLGRKLRGVRPGDLLRVYLTQNDILGSLDEGLVSFDTGGRVRLVNRAAARMLGHREDLLVGKQVDDLLRAENGESLTKMTGSGIATNRSNILAQAICLPDSNLWARRVLILVDKSEAMRQAEQLNGTRHIITALRANTHEFLNKLQVISGLLQMGYTKEAQAYIGDLSATHARSIGPVLKLIRNANVAALILGKQVNMRELNISLTLLNNSTLPEHSKYLSSEELVTVVGNLLENAIEAVNAMPGDAIRSVVLQITEDDKGLLVMCSDSGEGIGPEVMPHIFETGFSTKVSQGRGVGMVLVKEIVDRHGGSIDVDTEPGSGTTFTLILNHERGGGIC